MKTESEIRAKLEELHTKLINLPTDTPMIEYLTEQLILKVQCEILFWAVDDEQ